MSANKESFYSECANTSFEVFKTRWEEACRASAARGEFPYGLKYYSSVRLTESQLQELETPSYKISYVDELDDAPYYTIIPLPMRE